MSWISLRRGPNVGCTLKVILDKPVHLVVFWLKPDVEGAKRVLVGEAVLKD